MKALSIRQPWAWAILHAGKRIENRDWKGCSYRGPLLIHAAKGCGKAEFDDAIESIITIGVPRDLVRTVAEMRVALRGVHHGEGTWVPRDVMPFGGIVGVCDVVDVVRESSDPWFFGPLGLVLANVRPLPMWPFKGALGFFDVPDHLVPGAHR